MKIVTVLFVCCLAVLSDGALFAVDQQAEKGVQSDVNGKVVYKRFILVYSAESLVMTEVFIKPVAPAAHKVPLKIATSMRSAGHVAIRKEDARNIIHIEIESVPMSATATLKRALLIENITQVARDKNVMIGSMKLTERPYRPKKTRVRRISSK